MKSILMTLLFLTGFAASQLDAQVCCEPCPPGCCLTTSNADGSMTFTQVKEGAKITCTPEQLKSCTPEQMKACTPEQVKACNKGAAFGTATKASYTDVNTTPGKSTHPSGTKGGLQE